MPDVLLLLLRLLSLIAGLLIVFWTIISVIRMLLLPRSTNVPLVRFMFSAVFMLIDWTYLRRLKSFEARDRIMGFWPPLTLLALVFTWLFLLMIGFAFIFLGMGAESFRQALEFSGSSLMTLGIRDTKTLPMVIVAFAEAAMGMIFVALIIGYLPQMYGAYTEREQQVTRLEYYAGVPFSSVEMIARLNYIGILYDPDRSADFFETWELWFAQTDVSHTTLAPLNFFRSPKPGRSWLVAAGTVLDGASLIASVVDVPLPRQGGIMIRSGFSALRSIADFFRVPYDPNPEATDAISVSREEFEAACDELAEKGVEIRSDRDQAWRDFAGWRVNYDAVLRHLAQITYAPYAPWISDHILDADGEPRNHLLKPAEGG
jgi:hypothetical protein